MSSALPNRLKDADCPSSQPDVTDPSCNDGVSVSQAEAAAIRADKLEAIKAAVEAGLYDSDEVLHKALGKMIESVKEQD